MLQSMFFLLRSACCIGLVMAALPAPGGRPTSPLASAAAPALAEAEKLCRAAPDRCIDLFRSTVRSSSAELFRTLAVRPHEAPSRDTLTVADRLPAWLGPEGSAPD
jgi:hypothetical protein